MMSLGEVAEISGGLTRNASKRDAALVRAPLVSVAAVQLRRIDVDAVGEVGILESDADRATLRAGDLLVVEGNGSLDHIGRVALWNDEVPGARHQNHIIRVRPHELSSRYVLEWLASPLGREAIVREATSAAGLYTLSLSKVERIPIPVPPGEVDRRIVAKLDSLQSKSRRAKEALDAIPPLLERFRQSVLAAAFRGDLTADWRAKNPDVEPASQLLKRIRVERRRRWEEAELAKMTAKGRVPGDDRWKGKYEEPEAVDSTGLPALPEGWTWAGLSEVAELQLGQRRAPEFANDAMFPYVRAANITWRGLDLSDVKTMGFAEPDRLILRPGDVVLSEASGSAKEVGKPALWRGEIPRCCFQATVLRVRSQTESVSGAWLHLSFLRDATLGAFAAMAPGVGILHLTAERMRAWPVPVAPAKEQARLAEVVDHAMACSYAQEDATNTLSRRATSLDSAILAKAFRGELVPQDRNDEPASEVLTRLAKQPDALAPANANRRPPENSAATSRRGTVSKTSRGPGDPVQLLLQWFAHHGIDKPLGSPAGNSAVHAVTACCCASSMESRRRRLGSLELTDKGCEARIERGTVVYCLPLSKWL